MMALSDETLIFLHIPKAGGMTLHGILERRYPREQIFTFGRKPHEAFRRFEAMPEAQRARYRVLKGHVPFGLHHIVPTPSTYFTFLRDPIERVISQYYYAKSRPEHYLYKRLNQDRLTLFDYAARRVTRESENQQTGMLGGLRTGTEITLRTLELAKQNLQTHFRVVGLTEQFDASLVLLGRAFRWGNPFYMRENTTNEKPQGADIEPRARALLAELNAFDLELYRFARELFERQCREYGGQLARDVERFRRWNARYQQLVGPFTRLRQRVRVRSYLTVRP